VTATALATDARLAEGAEPSRAGAQRFGELMAPYHDGHYRFVIYRLKPLRIFADGFEQSVGGFLDAMESPPSVELIKERFGGGLYRVRIMKARKLGAAVAEHTVLIHGAVKLPELPHDEEVCA
jgi:hypothetical protein